MRHWFISKHVREPNYDPVSAIIAVAAVSSAYTSYESRQDAKKAASRAEAEAKRVASETAPEGTSATLQVGGSDTLASSSQSTANFLVPKTSALGTSGSSGLGF